jgi:hypothetical protein
MPLLRRLKRNRVKLAFCVALMADAVQIPASMLAASGVMLPLAEFFIVFVDLIATGLIMWCLGFHWILLPSFALEAIPGLDAIPTWTLCVLYVARMNRNGSMKAKDDSPVIDIDGARVVSGNRASANAGIPPIIRQLTR